MVVFMRDSRETDRIREGRRGSTAAAAMNGGGGGGMSRRRPRIGSLRESPEHEEKEIDGGASRDRCRNRSGRRKRRREDRLIYAGDGDEAGVASDESVEKGDGGDILPPPPRLASAPARGHRRSGFHASSRSPAAWWLDDVDEIIGVPVPRKARSASRRRSRDCWVSKIARPSSPSTIQEIEMEVAEVLFGMTRQHHQLPEQESRPALAPPTEEENLREAKVDDELASHVAPPPADSQAIDAQQSPELPVAGSNESKEFPRRAEDESNETEFSIAVKEEDEGRSRSGGRRRVQKQQASPAPASILSSFHPHRPKRCATHCYVARKIYHHQQTAKLTPPPTAASPAAPTSDAKPCSLNAAPSSEPPGKSSNGDGKGSLPANFRPASLVIVSENEAPMAKAMPFLNGALCPPPATTTAQHGQHPLPSSSSSSLKQPPLRLPLYQLRQPVTETANGREVSSLIAMKAAAPPRTFELSFASMNNPAAAALPPPVGHNFSAAMATHQKLPPPLSTFRSLSEVSARLSIAAGKVAEWNPAAAVAIAKPPARSGAQLQHQSLDFSRPDSGGEKGRLASSNASSSSTAAAAATPVFSFSNPLQLEESRMQDLEQVYLRDELQRILKRQLSSPPPPPPQLPSRDIRALMAAGAGVAPATHISFGGTTALAPAAGAAGSKSAPSPAPTSTSRKSAPTSGHRFMDMDSILGRPPPPLVPMASGSSSSSTKQLQQLKLPPPPPYPQPLLFSSNNNPYMQYQAPQLAASASASAASLYHHRPPARGGAVD